MSADLALLTSDPSSLELFDDPGKQIELACQRANAWLKAAIDDARIETIVQTKAQAAALAAFAVQKQLGHDAELAALEVQRRAERGIGLAIRRGQEAGEIAGRGDVGGPGGAGGVRGGVSGSTRNEDLVRVTDAAGVSHHSEVTPLYAMTDGVTDDDFEDAIEDAKAEGNLSRANVVRKIKGQRSSSLTTTQKVEKIEEMAARGHSSDQIARELGHTEDWIRELARKNDIDIPADRILRGTRRLDHTKFINETVASLEALASGLDVLDFSQVDLSNAEFWATSLKNSLHELNRLRSRITKEMTRD